jgi:TM2 domain-containing membrane protein YozV
MEQKQIDHLLMIHSSKLAPEHIEFIRGHLADFDYNQAVMLFSTLKDPTTVLIISILVGSLGVDRFYIGDIGIGIGKLCSSLGITLITCGMLFFVGWIWWIIDLFLIMDATRKKNSEVIMQALALSH